MKQLFTGTSGFAYKEWKGSFYPEDLSDKKMLPFYASHFGTVEINNTFYRMPSDTVLADWSSQVPAHFRFILKASRQITHNKRLKEVAEPVEYFLKTSAALGEKRGPFLFQLPPNLKKDVERLKTFLALLPVDVRAALEFRHESWHDEDVFTALRDRNAALCIAHVDEEEGALQTPFVVTADWGYLRLRKVGYGPGELEDWAVRAKQPSWGDVFVFFKHEDEGTGPKLAKRFEQINGSTN
ncbi:MAG: DUF72 domain-containing protein [Gemmatimonadota bacterium]